MDRQANIEYLHDSGKMPDWYYYQVNGRTFQENYLEIRRKQQQKNRELIFEEREKAIKARKEKEFEAELDKQVEEKVGNAVEDAVEKAFEKLL